VSSQQGKLVFVQWVSHIHAAKALNRMKQTTNLLP